MDNSILYIIIALIVGVVFGKLDTVFTGSLKKGREAKKEQALAQEVEHLKQELERQKQIPAQPAPERLSALRVSLDEKQAWMVEIDGTACRPENINSEQRTRLINVLVQIRPWIDAKPVPAKIEMPAPAAPAHPVPSTPVPSASVPSASAASNLPPSPLRASIIGGLRSVVDTGKANPPSGLVSVVSLIDSVLQKQLAGTPLASRQIRMEEGPKGEVLVYVGAARYSGIDSVPDPEIVAAIKQAIAEFNREK